MDRAAARRRTTTHVRVLVAKDAISTGWDCPRAEVLVSFRPAKDHTHITQLLGRMVRNPLARRVPGDERLNSVDCILPFFDRTTAGKVVKFLTGADRRRAGRQPARRSMLDGRELLPERVDRRAGRSGRCGTRCRRRRCRSAAPARRSDWSSLAHALSADGVRPDALAEVESRAAPRPRRATPRATPSNSRRPIEEVWAVDGQTIAGRIGKTGADVHRVRRAGRRPSDPQSASTTPRRRSAPTSRSRTSTTSPATTTTTTTACARRS